MLALARPGASVFQDQTEMQRGSVGARRKVACCLALVGILNPQRGDADNFETKTVVVDYKFAPRGRCYGSLHFIQSPILRQRPDCCQVDPHGPSEQAIHTAFHEVVGPDSRITVHYDHHAVYDMVVTTLTCTVPTAELAVQLRETLG